MRLSAHTPAVLGIFVAALALPACEQDSGKSLLSIDATGSVQGLVFQDLNGNGIADIQDGPAEGVQVQLVTWGSGAVVDEAVSDSEGRFSFADAPVGTYTMSVNFSQLADTLMVVGLDDSAIVVPADSAATTVFGISLTTVTIEEARSLPVGTPVFVEGEALAGPLTWSDRTGHFRDGDFAIRGVSMVVDALFPGDTVRVRGRTGTNAGQPVLVDAKAYVLAGFGSSPAPIPLTTGEAAGAQGGTLDANLVRIESAVVSDTFRIGNDLVARVDDASGELEILLDGDVSWLADVAPGKVFNFATGVLVPVDGSASWQLKPRTRFDIAVN
jgi:hypothetical protein